MKHCIEISITDDFDVVDSEAIVRVLTVGIAKIIDRASTIEDQGMAD